MILVISPSKTLDFSANSFSSYTQARKLDNSQELIETLRQLNAKKLQQLMKISEKLGQLNWQRYQEFQQPFTLDNAKQALLAFKGDVYAGIDTENYAEQELSFAQNHLRILSGLYGLLKPLDLIQPYRLEMGTSLANSKGKNLYEFWGTQITDLLNQDLLNDKSPILINLASNEYFKVIKPKLLSATILTLSFKENKSGIYKTIGIHAKKARGLMTDYIIKNHITEPQQLKAFNCQNYSYNKTLSSQHEWVFSR